MLKIIKLAPNRIALRLDPDIHMEYGYSMADIARKAEVHYSTVSRVIKGER